MGGFARGQPLANISFDVLDHDDGVIDDDADRQHQGEQRQGVDRIAQRQQDGEGADEGDGNGQHRDDGRTPGLQEDQDDDGHQDDGFDDDVLDRRDGRLDIFGGVVGDGVFDARREVGCDDVQFLQNGRGRRQGVGPRLLDDGDGDARLAREGGVDVVVLGAQFDAGDIADAGQAALGVGLDDDVGELVRLGQPALDVDRKLEGRGVGGEGRLAHGPGGRLDVLRPQGGDDFRRRQVARGGLGRVDPDAHRIVAAAEHLDLADAVDPQQAVADRRVGQVAQVVGIDAGIGGGEGGQQQEAARALVHHHADLAHLFGQFRLGQGDAVLDQHLGRIQVGARLERHGDGHRPVRGRGRGHVDHALDAIDLLLDRRGDGLGQGLSRGAGVGRADVDRRGGDLGILRQRQVRQGEGPDQGDEDRDHDREDRSVDEEAGDVHESGSGP
ncbi:hypothetical protein D3C73_875500 [compost metagenome]